MKVKLNQAVFRGTIYSPAGAVIDVPKGEVGPWTPVAEPVKPEPAKGKGKDEAKDEVDPAAAAGDLT